MEEWIDGIKFSTCIKNPKFICVDSTEENQQCQNCMGVSNEPDEKI
jgi:hypothetical protein